MGGLMLAYNFNGGCRMISDSAELLPGEVARPEGVSPEELEAIFPGVTGRRRVQEALRQLEALEAMITPRRLREAILGVDGGWLANMERRIGECRESLAGAPTAGEPGV